jgi:signal transduction histidine kinase
VIIPAFIGELLLGFFTLDERRDRRGFSQEDLNALQVLANQAALAIENAVFYEETGKTLAETFHESRLRSIGTLGAGIGHQINNRFTAIASPAQVASFKIANRDLESLSAQELKDLLIYSKQILDSISEDALRGGKIATSLTSFSRKTEGYSAVSFAKVMEEVLSLLSCKFKLEELDLKQEVSADTPLLWGNLSQLDEVFFNLLDNAHDALMKKLSEAKAGKSMIHSNYQPRVILEAAALDNKFLRIILEDNGIGMTEEQLESLFIPFFTTKATAGKGTGLGLWMIKQIVEAHHGTIIAESSYGQGTKFSIALPLATKEQLQNNLKEVK